jgi:hypothetical protein
MDGHERKIKSATYILLSKVFSVTFRLSWLKKEKGAIVEWIVSFPEIVGCPKMGNFLSGSAQLAKNKANTSSSDKFLDVSKDIHPKKIFFMIPISFGTWFTDTILLLKGLIKQIVFHY